MFALYVWLVTWLKSEKAQDLIEYAVIIGLVLVVAIAGLGVLGGQISTLWSRLGTWMSGVAAQVAS